MNKRLISLFLVLATIVIPVSVVLAAPVQPDSGPFLLSVSAYRHYLEDNDMLIGTRYNVPNATIPPETITENYIGRLIDGNTELARVAPFAFNDSGYGHGMFWMYLSATDAPTWNSTYTVELAGNPTLAWVGTPPSVNTTSIAWYSTTSNAATVVLLRAHILTWARELGNLWAVTMVIDPATGTVLNTAGETYFVNIVVQLRSVIPSLFQQTVQVITYTDSSSNRTQLELAKVRWPFDWSGMSDWLGLPSEEVLVTGVYFIVVAIIAVALSMRTQPQWGLFAMIPSLPLAAVLGMISWTWAALIAFACVFVLGFVLFIQRSGG